MDPAADLDTETPHADTHRAGAHEGARRRVEAHKEAVANRLDLDTVVTGDLGPAHGAIFVEERSPARIAKSLGMRRGADDIREEQRRQDPLRLGSGAPLDKSFWDLPAPRISFETVRRIIDEDRSED